MASGFPLRHSARYPRVIRALVAESSHSEVKPFCCHFLDAATARGMTGSVLLSLSGCCDCARHGGDVAPAGQGLARLVCQAALFGIMSVSPARIK